MLHGTSWLKTPCFCCSLPAWVSLLSACPPARAPVAPACVCRVVTVFLVCTGAHGWRVEFSRKDRGPPGMRGGDDRGGGGGGDRYGGGGGGGGGGGMRSDLKCA